jgi:hypothetical protein
MRDKVLIQTRDESQEVGVVRNYSLVFVSAAPLPSDHAFALALMTKYS